MAIYLKGQEVKANINDAARVPNLRGMRAYSAGGAPPPFTPLPVTAAAAATYLQARADVGSYVHGTMRRVPLGISGITELYRPSAGRGALIATYKATGWYNLTVDRIRYRRSGENSADLLLNRSGVNFSSIYRALAADADVATLPQDGIADTRVFPFLINFTDREILTISNEATGRISVGGGFMSYNYADAAQTTVPNGLTYPQFAANIIGDEFFFITANLDSVFLSEDK